MGYDENEIYKYSIELDNIYNSVIHNFSLSHHCAKMFNYTNKDLKIISTILMLR
jgi:hypothetical protein